MALVSVLNLLLFNRFPSAFVFVFVFALCLCHCLCLCLFPLKREDVLNRTSVLPDFKGLNCLPVEYPS